MQQANNLLTLFCSFLLDRGILKLHVPSYLIVSLNDQQITPPEQEQQQSKTNEDNFKCLETVQQGYMFILSRFNNLAQDQKQRFCINYYAVYAHLKRLGFIVKRHARDLYVNSKTQNTNNKPSQSRKRGKKKRVAPLPIFEFENTSQSQQQASLKNDSLLKQLQQNNGIDVNVKQCFDALSSVIKPEKLPQAVQQEEFIIFDVWKSADYEKSTKKQQNRPTFAVLACNMMSNGSEGLIPFTAIAALQEFTHPTPVYVAAVNASAVSFLNMEANFEIPFNEPE